MPITAALALAMSSPPKGLERGVHEPLTEIGVGDTADAKTVSRVGVSSRSLPTTTAPSRASFSATARPLPRPALVTIATLPVSLITCRSLA